MHGPLIVKFKDSSLSTCNYYISCHVIHNVVDFRKQEWKN